jgi:hypothetical protein
MMLQHWALAAALLSLGTGTRQQIGASRTVLATVLDTRGRSIVDLEADDFVIRETGKLRDVLSVRVADYPIVLVLDNGPGAGRDLDAIRQSAARFIGRVGRRPVAVALSDPPRLIATLDDDRAVVMERLANVTASASTEGLFQAIVSAARTLQETGSPFSAVVVVSATPVSPVINVPSEVLTPVLESGAAVHVIINREGPAGAVGGLAGRPSETLRVLSQETHGQFTTIYSAASYQVALDRLADRLAPELMVEYVVPVGSSSGNDVSLGVRIPGARVNARAVTK